MKQYLISKSNYNGEVVYLNVDKNNGYKVNPKNKLDYGIKVNEMIVIKPDFIQKVIKRKIKNKLEFYFNYLISEDSSDDDTRKALGDLQRYRFFVKEKYDMFLDKKYLSILDNKFDILERNLKSKIITNAIKEQNVYEEEIEHRRSR